MPDVELERPRLRKPEQRRQVVAHQVVVPFVLVLGKHGDALDEVRPLLLPVLLEETLAADAVGHADHREWTVGQVRQDVGRDLCAVDQEVALGVRGKRARRIRGPVDAIEVGELDPVRADGQRDSGLPVLQLCDDFVGRLRRGAGNGAPHQFRIDVVAQPQEHGRAQVIVVGPTLEAHLGDGFGLDPRRRRVLFRLFHERTCASLELLQPFLGVRQRALVEARSDVRCVMQQLVVVPIPDQERAQRRARAFSLSEAADDEVRSATRA